MTNKYILHNSKWYWLVLIFGTIIFYILNYNTTMSGDDILYAYIPGNESQRCDTIGKYIMSMPYFYQDTNGRIADMIVRFISSLIGKTIFNILNTLVFAIFVHTIACIIGDNNPKPWLLGCIFFYFLYWFPNPGTTMLWQAGAVNYMWSATATLIIILYIIRHNDTQSRSSVTIHTLLAVAAFIAGGMNESISTATLVTLGCFFLFNFKQWRGINVTITIAYLLGTLLVISSPAAWNRLEGGNVINLHIGFSHLIFQRAINIFNKSTHYITPLIGMYTLFILLWCNGFKKHVSNILIWLFVGAVFSILVFGDYNLPPRAYTWFSLTGFIITLYTLVPIVLKKQKLVEALGIIAALSCVIQTRHALKETYELKIHEETVISEILASPDGVIKVHDGPTEARFYHSVSHNNKYHTDYNEILGTYYGKDNVQFLNDSVYARYKSPLPMLHGGKLLNYISSNLQWATSIYGFPGSGYSIIPLKSHSIIDYQGMSTFLYYTNIEEHLGQKETKRLMATGRLKDYDKCKQYHLKRDGEIYLILPELNDSITKIEIPILVGKKEEVLTFTHK